MILEFEVENYRSIKDKQVLSMVAESSKSKPNNVFEHQLASGETVRLLKAAVIYGANASGKSNLLKALVSLRNFILSKLSVNDLIEFYDPFLFDTQSKDKPTKFTLTFVGIDNHKYRYEISFNKKEIFKENLDYFPKGKAQNLIKRPIKKTANGEIHVSKLGQIRNHKEISVFKNQLTLSKFGFDTPDDFFLPVYQYFKLNSFSNLSPKAENDLNYFRESAEQVILDNKDFLPYLSKLMQLSDTKMEKVNFRERFFINSHSGEEKTSHKIEGIHPVFENHKKVGTKSLSFEQQSKGSNILFSLGTAIIYKLKKGGIFIIDEIDTSLHPKLAKTLISLFQLPRTNPKNAQIIFTTHETAFLDKDLFRKDQIWFTEKNEYGETELFSAQNFDKVREDTPFDKWYMAGKFGGIPDIQALEAIFSNGKTK